LADKDGNYRELYEFRGKFVAVDFWASRCGVCRRENPKLEALSHKYSSQIQVIGVNLDQKKELWQAAVNSDQLTYLQVHDTLAFNSEIAKSYGITMIPFMMLLDANRVILMFTSSTTDIESRLNNSL
jgi:thiol-disulfide isomerase/thioredoxin